MEDGSVDRRMRRIVNDECGVAEDSIRSDSKFTDDFGMDSLDCVEFIMAVEEAFDIEIPDEDAEAILTFQEAVNYVEDKI